MLVILYIKPILLIKIFSIFKSRKNTLAEEPKKEDKKENADVDADSENGSEVL
jgi:hypothetical protein